MRSSGNFKVEIYFDFRGGRSGRSDDMVGKRVKEVYGNAKKVHLCMTIYNLSTAGIIFSHKLLCLQGSVVGLYFLIRLMFVQPVISVFFFVVAFNSITFYTVLWDNASLIPVMIGLLKAEIAVVTSARTAGRVYFRLVSRSIPNVGVKVGGFRNIERDSTMIFADFVVDNVVSLLISMKR